MQYLWADGIYFNLRLDEGLLCVLVQIGATPEGNKGLVAVCEGDRECTKLWLKVLRDLKERNILFPSLCIGDGAFGFWKAIRKAYTEKNTRAAGRIRLQTFWTNCQRACSQTPNP